MEAKLTAFLFIFLIHEGRVPSPGLLQDQASKNGAYRYNNIAHSVEILQIIPRAFTLNDPGKKFTCEVNSLSSSLKIVYPHLDLLNLME